MNITFANKGILGLVYDESSRSMIKVSKIKACKKLGKQRELLRPNTGNILVLIIVFQWGRIYESAVDKSELKCNAKLHPSYFSVNVNKLVVKFRRKY